MRALIFALLAVAAFAAANNKTGVPAPPAPPKMGAGPKLPMAAASSGSSPVIDGGIYTITPRDRYASSGPQTGVLGCAGSPPGTTDYTKIEVQTRITNEPSQEWQCVTYVYGGVTYYKFTVMSTYSAGASKEVLDGYGGFGNNAHLWDYDTPYVENYNQLWTLEGPFGTVFWRLVRKDFGALEPVSTTDGSNLVTKDPSVGASSATSEHFYFDYIQSAPIPP